MFRGDPLEFQQAFFERHPGAASVMELFEAIPNVLFYAKDTASRFVRVNAAFMESHGVSRAGDILGRTDRDFSPPAFAEAYIAEDRRVMAGRRAIPGQLWMVFHPGQKPYWYNSTKVPMFDPVGRVIGIAGAMYAIERPEQRERIFQELGPALRHFEKHYGEDISMRAMASLCGLSSTHFNRRFQHLLRCTPSRHLLSIRVHVACRLLSGTSRPLASIAAETGFTDQSHFTRCFRQNTGLTPRSYRLKFQK